MQNIFHQMLTLSALTLSCAEENIMMVICFLQWDSFVVVYRTPGTTGMGKCTMFQQRKKKTTGICFHENQKFVQIICFISFWYSHISKEKKKRSGASFLTENIKFGRYILKLNETASPPSLQILIYHIISWSKITHQRISTLTSQILYLQTLLISQPIWSKESWPFWT